MKIGKIIWIIAIIYIIIQIVWDIICFGGRYDTAEEAIMKSKDVKVKEVISVLEDKNYAVGLYRQEDITEGIESRYLRKDENGWKILDSNVFFYQKIKIVESGTFLAWYKDKGNCLIKITNASSISEEEIIPKDSINSEFKCFSKASEISEESRLSVWFLVIEDLPKDYTITIKDKEYKIK